MEKCPVENFERKMLQNGIFSENDVNTYKEAINSEIEEAFLFAKESPFPTIDLLNQHIYEE